MGCGLLHRVSAANAVKIHGIFSYSHENFGTCIGAVTAVVTGALADTGTGTGAGAGAAAGAGAGVLVASGKGWASPFVELSKDIMKLL